jgi:hypothetical protein
MTIAPQLARKSAKLRATSCHEILLVFIIGPLRSNGCANLSDEGTALIFKEVCGSCPK